MLKPHLGVWMFSVGLIGSWTDSVSAQDYPTKPIRIVTSAPGGGTDFISRLLAQEMSVSFGQQVIVDNRPTGVIPGQIVSQAPPDGYTLLVAGSTFATGPLLQKTPYDPVSDFAPISLADKSPNILVVHPSLPPRSVKELIALAKAKPGQLNYASTATGGAIHLTAELFKAMAGVNIVRIAYRGTGPALTAMLGGEVHLGFFSTPSVTPHLKAGRLRSLAVTSAGPTALAPGLPTVAASGIPGFEVESIDSILAPARTPAAIVRRLNQEIVRVLSLADVKAKFLSFGMEASPGPPEQLAATIRSEIAKWGKIIKDANIQGEP